MAEPPEPAPMTCTSASRSTPVALPTSSAWASVEVLAAATELLMTLICWPCPSGPAWTITSPIASNSGQARRTCSSAPPAMIVSVPSSAFGDEPVTGASTKLGIRSPMARARSAPTVDMSTKTVSAAASAAAPCGPSSASSTCGPSTSIVMTTSPRTWAGVSAIVPPCSPTHVSAFSRVRLWTVSSCPALTRLAAIREPMIPRPIQPTRMAGTLRRAVPTAARRLEPQALAGAQRPGSLRLELVALEQRATRRAGLAAVGPRGRMAAALGEDREGHLLERLGFADHAIAAAVAARAAAAPAHRVLGHPQRELEFERLDRCVERVRHGDVDRARAVGVRARALTAAQRLVVGEVLVAEGDVVHRPLTERSPERGENEVGHARGGLDVAAGDRRRRPGVEQRALGRPDLDRAVGAGGGRDVGVRQDADGEVAGRARHGERAVEVAAVLSGAAAEVEDESVAVHRGRQPQLEVALARLEHVGRVVRAVVEG